ncbi:13704_t:CDS:2, partial [Rhizophagus irregularis]
DARDWYETHIKGKNWECVNLLNNLGVANLGAVNGMNNGAIVGVAANQFRGGAGALHGQAAAHYFSTITSEKSKLAFNAIVQGSDAVSRFYSKLRRMVRLAYPILPEINQNELVWQQFLNGLSSENKLEARRIADIENLINSKIPVTMARSSAVPVPSSSPFSSPQNDTSFQRLLALAYKLGLPRDVDISKVTLSDLEIFIDTELNKNLPPDHIYRGNQVFGISSGTRKPKKSKKCSSCGKSGHTKSSCPKSKKGKRKTNYAHDSSDPSDLSNSSDSFDSSDSDSDSGHACYGIKKKPTERKRVDKKTTDKKKSQLERQRIIFE